MKISLLWILIIFIVTSASIPKQIHNLENKYSFERNVHIKVTGRSITTESTGGHGKPQSRHENHGKHGKHRRTVPILS
jgi:hypothetical protein